MIVVFKYYLYVVSVYDKLFDVVIKRRIYVVLHRLYFIKFNPAIKQQLSGLCRVVFYARGESL